MGPGKAHSFEALPDRKVARIGEASILRKPFKAIHLVHIGKGLGQVDHKVFNCLFYYASLDFVIDDWTHAGPVKYQARAVDIRRNLGLDGQRNNSQLRQSMERLCRSEEHTSELQSLMRNSYAVFCLKKHNINNNHTLPNKTM